jgi:translocation and assembly module TamB
VSLVTIDGLSSTWDADLDLSGRGGEAWLQGGARLVRGVYTRDLSLLSMALAPSRREEAVEEGRLHLLVRVRLDDNLAVRTRTADLRAGGALTVQGTTGTPVVFGAIESRDGRIVFRGHDFTVQNASVRFADPRAVDPLLDVTATSRIREYEVTVQVSGRLSDLSVRMSSVPRLPPDDLVALVSLGATREELKDSAATIIAGETGKALAQSLLGIDPSSTGLRLSVVSSDEGRGDPYRIWEEDRDRSASATRRTGDRHEKVRLEYRLLDQPVYLSGEYDPEGGYGADVIFRLRFR